MLIKAVILGPIEDIIAQSVGRLIQSRGNMDYYVFYVKDCVPRVKKFKSSKDATAFSDKLIKNRDEDNWPDYIIEGDMVEVFDDSRYLLKDLVKYGKTSKTKTS